MADPPKKKGRLTLYEDLLSEETRAEMRAKEAAAEAEEAKKKKDASSLMFKPTNLGKKSKDANKSATKAANKPKPTFASMHKLSSSTSTTISAPPTVAASSPEIQQLTSTPQQPPQAAPAVQQSAQKRGFSDWLANEDEEWMYDKKPNNAQRNKKKKKSKQVREDWAWEDIYDPHAAVNFLEYPKSEVQYDINEAWKQRLYDARRREKQRQGKDAKRQESQQESAHREEPKQEDLQSRLSTVLADLAAHADAMKGSGNAQIAPPAMSFAPTPAMSFAPPPAASFAPPPAMSFAPPPATSIAPSASVAPPPWASGPFAPGSSYRGPTRPPMPPPTQEEIEEKEKMDRELEFAHAAWARHEAEKNVQPGQNRPPTIQEFRKSGRYLSMASENPEHSGSSLPGLRPLPSAPTASTSRNVAAEDRSVSSSSASPAPPPPSDSRSLVAAQIAAIRAKALAAKGGSGPASPAQQQTSHSPPVVPQQPPPAPDTASPAAGRPGVISAAPTINPEYAAWKARQKAGENDGEDAQPAEDPTAPRSNRPGQSGFAERMLKKMGWEEGKGLGASGEGITTAIVAKAEKRKKKSDAQGGGFVTPANMGKIVGGKKAKSANNESSNNPDDVYGPMSEVIKLDDILANMDVDKEIQDNNILQEIGDEMGAFGKVERLYIWRDTVGGHNEVFVKFTSQLSALRAVKDMDGIEFAGNTVKARFWDAEKFERGEYEW